ncbi:hypothetical protein D046_6519 [Vibrio parahaemolyticus V-223/04]|nr:hypothetical protein D046_6519 [Vibrio parahaemolyticus V-223/04]
MWFGYGKWLVLSEVIARFASRETSKIIVNKWIYVEEIQYNVRC